MFKDKMLPYSTLRLIVEVEKRMEEQTEQLDVLFDAEAQREIAEAIATLKSANTTYKEFMELHRD